MRNIQFLNAKQAISKYEHEIIFSSHMDAHSVGWASAPVANGIPVGRVSQAKEKTALPTVNEKQPHAYPHEVRKNYII